MLTIDQLSYAWGDKPALCEVSLQVPGGNIVALLGPNGAGKSTLLRCILDQLKPDTGSIRMEGANHRATPIGWVPQSITLYPQLTARENLEVFGRVMGIKKASLATAVDDTLDVIGLTARAGKPANTLSGGMQRMLNIGMALVSSPRLMLIDEPTAGIDQRARQQLHELLMRLKADGMTILLTTHDLEDATRLADRVAILVEGRLRAEGPVARLVEERFARLREVRVQVTDGVPADIEAQLRQANLEPAGQGLWRGLHAPGPSLDALLTRLSGDNRNILETSVRRPGLDLFLHELLNSSEDAK